MMRNTSRRAFLGSLFGGGKNGGGVEEELAKASKGGDAPHQRQRSTLSQMAGSTVPPPRSAIFVPCSNLKALNKIHSLNADVFILDLEDSVPMGRKDEARRNLIEFVTAGMRAAEEEAENGDAEGASGMESHSTVRDGVVIGKGEFRDVREIAKEMEAEDSSGTSPADAHLKKRGGRRRSSSAGDTEGIMDGSDSGTTNETPRIKAMRGLSIKDAEEIAALQSKGKPAEKPKSLRGKRLIVRVNSPSAPESAKYGIPDMEAVDSLGAFLDGVGVPKVTAHDAHVLPSMLNSEHDVWAFIETPKGVLQVEEVCASGLYQYVAMGLNDLSMELQLPLSYHNQAIANALREKGATSAPKDQQLFNRRMPLLHAMSRVVMAARAYGVHPIDGVFNDPSDPNGFRQECLEALSMGFSGKTLIHPSQIDIVHEIFTPSQMEVDWARKVVAAIEASEGGVAVVDGKMVEDLHAKMAVRILSHLDL